MKKENIKIDSHVGTWYVIDQTKNNGKAYYLLEHEEYGDLADSIIIDKDNNVILENVQNGLSELDERTPVQNKKKKKSKAIER
jgi:hypothetical protein